MRSREAVLRLDPEQEGPEKRFAPSREAFAQERFAALKDSMRTLKAEAPEVLSFSAFGSMARGNPNLKSDIDGYLYVDVTSREKEDSDRPYLEEETESGGMRSTYLVKEEARKYGQRLVNLMVEHSDMTPEQVKQGVKIRPISDKILEAHVDDLLNAVNKDLAFENELKTWEERRPARGMAGDLRAFLEYQRSRPERSLEPASSSTTLFGMFHLDVGGGLREYRAKLLDTLAAKGEAGERAWGKIIKGTEQMENYLSASDKRYPHTLAEAQAVYGRKKPEDRRQT